METKLTAFVLTKEEREDLAEVGDGIMVEGLRRLQAMWRAAGRPNLAPQEEPEAEPAG